MNERIQELMLEAGKTIPGDKHIDADFCKKFAELIVRECARIARNTDLEDVEGGYSAVLRAAGEQIKQHFGVDE